ncbi:hypothetical protein K449DRAFT_383890 [Hypoxylon sp. EC38]|nr:hypothetical protein K449DRAFT_383890 [Hypoxylon sp. EC38]
MYYTAALWSDGVQGIVLMEFIALGCVLAVYSVKYIFGPILGAKSLLDYMVSSQHESENLEEKSRGVQTPFVVAETYKANSPLRCYITEPSIEPGRIYRKHEV